MNCTPSTPKELADTSASFFNAPAFHYRSQETAIDFVLLRDRQKQRVLDAFRGDSAFTEEKLVVQLERVEEESNQFIQSLLQELADQCKRTRTIQAEFDVVIRDKNTQARRLAEQVLDTASRAQMDRNKWEQERGVLQREARQAQKASKSTRKECQGLRQLLEEYQDELQAANAKIEQMFKESAQITHMIELMTDKLEKLTLALSDSEEKHIFAIQQMESLTSQLQSSQQDYERVQKTLCDYKSVEERNKNLEQQCIELREKQLEQTALLEYLERKLLQVSGQVVRQESKCLNIQASSSMDIQQLINRENQWKTALQDVEAKAKLGMSKLKENYDKKLRKIVTYFQKEVRDLKFSCNSMKENLQKQMLLFFKLTQRDFRENQICLKEKNRVRGATMDRQRSRCILEPMLQN